MASRSPNNTLNFTTIQNPAILIDMGSRRQDVDLELLLRDPKCARHWINTYQWDAAGRPKYLVWGLDRKIYLDKMDDDDAVMAAFIILKEYEIPRALEELRFEPSDPH